MSGNQAVAINDNAVNNADSNYGITTHGSDWYWAVCAVMIVSTLVFLGLAATKPRTHRIFHYITAGITMVASIAYFTLGSHLGYTGIPQEFIYNSSQTIREIYYVRYIDWVITTPLLLTDLLLTAGMTSQHILMIILVDEIMIVTGLVGALVSSSYKWGYWTFGTVALFYILYVLAFEARHHASHLGADIGRVFTMTGSLTAVLWLLYPIAWGLCEGANYLHPDSEAVFYGVLDVFAKPVFGALLLYGHAGIDLNRLGLVGKDYADTDFSVRKSDKQNKEHASSSHPTATNGTTTAEAV